MLVKVRTMVAKHECIHVLSVDNRCEGATYASYPLANCLGLIQTQISNARRVSARLDHQVAEVRLRAVAQRSAVAHVQQLVLVNRSAGYDDLTTVLGAHEAPAFVFAVGPLQAVHRT
jgi:hypothetical protein